MLRDTSSLAVILWICCLHNLDHFNPTVVEREGSDLAGRVLNSHNAGPIGNPCSFYDIKPECLAVLPRALELSSGKTDRPVLKRGTTVMTCCWRKQPAPPLPLFEWLVAQEQEAGLVNPPA